MVEPKARGSDGPGRSRGGAFRAAAGKRIGLITNHTGLSRDGKRNIDLMLAAGVKIAALFSPEHGLSGTEDQPNVANTKDPATGLPVIEPVSRDAPASHARRCCGGVDALVFRYSGRRRALLHLFLHHAVQHGRSREEAPAVLRARPSESHHRACMSKGPILDRDLESFVGCYEIPLRHGMTLGELANMANGERQLGFDLHVVPMRGWNRGDWFDSTGLAVGESFAEHAQPECGPAVPGPGDAGGVHELLGRPRHRRSVRADRRGLDPRPAARGSF